MHLFKLVLTLMFATSLGASASAGTPEGDKARADIKAALGFLPGFIKVVPDNALPGAWAEMAGLQMNPKTALSGKQKELIGLAVAAQVPCRYCIYAHTEFAKLNGASDAEVGEAVTMAALTRHWSTFLNGIQPDEAAWRAQVDKFLAYAKNPPKAPAVAPAPQADPVKQTYAEVEGALGNVPEFIARFPASGVVGAWTEWRDVELAPNTALDGKTKSLIGIAVAAQIPCRYCVIADTAFAKLGGASDKEIEEAIAMAAIVRHWSTLLNGLQVDEKGFKSDVDRLVRDTRKALQVKHADSK